jgi:DNA-binding CsgD family transcriptional regulator
MTTRPPTNMEHFGDVLLALAQGIARAPLERILYEALSLMHEVVPFRAAWWGQATLDAVTGVPTNWTHGAIGLSATFVEEWERIAPNDQLARASLSSSGETFVASVDNAEFAGLPEIDAFCRRHQMAHAMAVSHELPGDGAMFFVSINRDQSGKPFSLLEQGAFSSFVRHVCHHWRQRIEVERSVDGLAGWENYGLADHEGRLLYVGRRMADALRYQAPDWSGTLLPVAPRSEERGPPQLIQLGRSARLAVEARRNFLALRLVERATASGLPPRELGAAALYAQGRSNKEIAAVLGLTPSTVRTYLRNAYLHLGVKNKFELLTALKAPSGRPADKG